MSDEIKKEPEEKASTDNFHFLELDRRRELKFGLGGLKLLEQTYQHDHIPSLDDPKICEYCEQKKKQSGICEMPMLEFFEFIAKRIAENRISVDDLYKLVWAGLVREDEKLTLAATGKLLEKSAYHIGTLHELIGTIFISIGESTPEVKDEIIKKMKGVTLETVKKKGSTKAGRGASSSTPQ